MSDDRLIVSIETPNVLDGLALAEALGDAVSCYRIGLGLLTGGGLALANELAGAQGKRILMDLKLFDTPPVIEQAVRGLAQFGLAMLTVHGDPAVVRAARRGAVGSDMRIVASTILPGQNRDDLDAALIKPGAPEDIAVERAARALEAGADGVLVSAAVVARVRALQSASGRLVVAEVGDGDTTRGHDAAHAMADGADHVVIALGERGDLRGALEAILRRLDPV